MVLSAAQKSEKKKNQGILLQKNLVSFANMVEEEAKKDISKETAQMLMDEVKSSKKEVSKVKEAFDEAINLNPSAFNELEANCNQIIKELDEKFNNLVIALFPKTAVTSPSSSSTISSASSAPVTYKEYAKEKIPTFDGSVRNYAQFKDEWKTCVIPGRDEKWCLIALNKHTPKQVDLRNVESLDEAWRELDGKYGNPVNVSATLIKDFIEYSSKSHKEGSKVIDVKNEVMRLYNDLKAINEEEQLTKNQYLINQIMVKLPRIYQQLYSREKRAKLSENPNADPWIIAKDFLKEEAFRLESDLPWQLDGDGKETEKFNKFKSNSNVKQVVNAIKAKNFDDQVKKAGPCVICQEIHTFVNKNNIENLDSKVYKCPTFLEMNVTEKAEAVRDNKICAVCLDYRHERTACKQKKSCKKKNCNFLHHHMLHGTSISYVNSQFKSSSTKESPVILLHMISHVLPNINHRLVFFMDEGATVG